MKLSKLYLDTTKETHRVNDIEATVAAPPVRRRKVFTWKNKDQARSLNQRPQGGHEIRRRALLTPTPDT
jgi:hypothetical protein